MTLPTGAPPDGLEEKTHASHTTLFVVCLAAIALSLVVTFTLMKLSTISGRGAMVYYMVHKQSYIEGHHKLVPIYYHNSYHFYGNNAGYDMIVKRLSKLHNTDSGSIIICSIQYNIKP